MCCLLQSTKKSSSDVEEGPPLLRYAGKEGRLKDEKELKVRAILLDTQCHGIILVIFL